MKKEKEFKLPEENKLQHTARAGRESKRNGGLKNIQRTKYGVQYNYKNGTGYWIDK